MAAITPLPLEITNSHAFQEALDARVGKPGELIPKVDGAKTSAEEVKDVLKDPVHGLPALKADLKSTELAAQDAKAFAEGAKNAVNDPTHGLPAIRAASVASNALRIESYLRDLEALFSFAETNAHEVIAIYEIDFASEYRRHFMEDVKVCFGDNAALSVRRGHHDLDEYLKTQCGAYTRQASTKNAAQLDRFELTSRLRAMRKALGDV